MGRPPNPDKRTHAYQFRLSDEEDALFQRLLEARKEELRGSGAEVSAPGLVRALIMREVGERGLDKPPSSKPGPGTNRAPGPGTNKMPGSGTRGGAKR